MIQYLPYTKVATNILHLYTSTMKRNEFLEKALNLARYVRILAKLIDLSIVFFLVLIFYFTGFYQWGLFLGILYLGLSDGLGYGQSFGKRKMGFGVKSLVDGAPCSYKQSIIRNSPLTLPLFLLSIPFWGWIVGSIVGTMIMTVELMLILQRDSGHRLGDNMAETTVMANDDHELQRERREELERKFKKNKKSPWLTANSNKNPTKNLKAFCEK